MHWLFFLAIGVVAVFAFIKFESGYRSKKIEAAFAGRASLQNREFYEKYFEAQGVPQDIVTGVRKVLEVQLDADLSRLVASDDFSKNIGFFFEFDSLADVEIVLALEEHFSINILDEEAANAQTIQDIVNLVWHKVQLRA